jgi:hypothetical protein
MADRELESGMSVPLMLMNLCMGGTPMPLEEKLNTDVGAHPRCRNQELT